MTELCICDDHVLRDCECSIEDTDCIHMNGSGNDTGLSPVPNLDPDPNNIWTKSAAGQLVKLPADIRAPAYCQVYRETDQSIATESGLVVTYSTARHDTELMYSASQPTRVTIITPGIYKVTFNCTWEANTAGDRQAYIRKNGREFLGSSQKRAPSTLIECGQSVTVQELFEAGEWIETMVKQDSGSTLDLLATRYSPILSVRYRRRPPTP